MWNSLTDVVKNLLIINVVIFGAFFLLPGLRQFYNYFVFYPPGTSSFRPVQIVTHMFNHANEMHLFKNMLVLFFFGPNVERVWGPKRFLFLYLVCGLGALLLHNVIDPSPNGMLGASGATTGVLLAFAYLYPNAQVMLLIPPIPLKAKWLVGGLLAYDLYQGLFVNSNIAHFAHLGGALTAVLLIYLFKKMPDFLN